MSGSGYMRKKPRVPNVVQRRGGSRAVPDKSVLQEGIYVNERFLHVIASLVGCTAQVQVKNGRVYEGILRTSSPKFEVVLERAHLVESSDDGRTSVPSHDQIIQTIIFSRADIVMLSFIDVNLDYAVTDNFTDGAISSKCNGQVREKELQPWVSDASLDDDALEGIDDSKMDFDNETGWDPNEMFATNSKKFNIKSDYDPSLSQYTTPLHKSDTAEFRQREEKAEQIAMEIERGIDHGVRSALENGDNEEMAFSAVQRPSPVPVSSPSAASPHLSIHRNASPGSSQSAGNGSGKYVAPHMRNNQSQPSTTSVPLQRPQHLAQIVSSPVSSSVASATISTSGGPGPVAAASLTPVAAVAAVSKPSVEAVPESTHGEPRVNGNDERINRVATEITSSLHHQPLQQQLANESREKTSANASQPQIPAPSSIPPSNSKPNIPKGAGNVVEELRQFQTNFKLSDATTVNSSANVVTTPVTAAAAVPVIDSATVAPSAVVVSTSHTPGEMGHQLTAVYAEKQQQPQRQPTPVDQRDPVADVLKKSVLNPMAKEFNPAPKAVSARVVPSTTPPRHPSVPPSPVSTFPGQPAATQMQSVPPTMYQTQPMYLPLQQQSQTPRYATGQQNKRVTVSARGTGELSQTPQATIMAGAPLITAQPMQLGQPGMFPQQYISVHASHPGPYPSFPMLFRPIMPVGQHDPGSLPQLVGPQPTSVFISPPVVPIAHPSMQAHMAPSAGAPMTSQQAQSAGAQSGVPHPPASGHQTPTPSQLQQYTIQPVGVMPPAASGTPQPGPPHPSAYHPLAPQHQASGIPHQMVVQQQNVGGQSGPAPQSPQVAYTSVPLPLHYTQGGIVAYVPAMSQAAQLQQQQQSHSINAASLSQQSSVSSGSSTVQHPPPQQHILMTTQQPQPGSASQHTMHPQAMPPHPGGPPVATQVIMPAQPQQPGGPTVVGAGPPGAHQYVHGMPGQAMAQGHISMPAHQHMMNMFVPHHSMHQGPPQVQNFQHGGPQQ